MTLAPRRTSFLLPCAVLLLGVSGLLGGCAATGDNAIFVTKTSFSLLDVDTTPGGASIAYDRVEAYVGPRFSDSSIYPVVGYISLGGQGFDRNIAQSYATGEAAIRLSGGPAAGAPSPSVQGPAPTNFQSTPNKVVYFATGTTAGLKIGFGDGGATSVVLGYKRKELSVIPVATGTNQPSVLATFNNIAGIDAKASGGASTTDDATKANPAADAANTVSGTVNTTGLSPSPKFDVQQYFATGIAAEQLAQDPVIQQQFRNAARVAMTPVQQYQADEAQQGRISLDVLSCLGTVDDAKLPRVWNNAEDLQIFLVSGAVDRIRAPPVASQRQRYLLEMDVLQVGGDPSSRTARLLLHKNVVCGLAANKGA